MNSRQLRRRHPLLAALPAEVVNDWLGGGRQRAVALGDVLFEIGSPGNNAYFVRSGRVRVLRKASGGKEVTLGRYEAGDLFGEYALLPPGKNTATCRMASAGELVELPLEPIRAAIASRPEIHRHLKRWLRLHALLSHLRDRSFLGFISATSLLPLLDRLESMAFPEGRTLQTDGLSADRWFVIVKGQARMTDEVGDTIVLGPGECFGEGALLGRAKLPTLESISAVECLSLRREAFTASLRDQSGVSMQTHVSRLPGPAACPWVAQQDAADCGLASLAMIARHHGRPLPLAELRATVPLGTQGLSLLSLKQAAEGIGFAGRAVCVGEQQLHEVALPAIAHWANDHYVVLYAVGSDSYLVGDPAHAVVEMSQAAFRRQWSGSLLILQPAA